ncbi:ribonuclease H-like domain-containing protein [Tanacetum coccineum]
MTKLPKCSCAAREDVLKHNKLMQFLMVLNDVFQPIRSSILSRESLPDVKDAFAIVSREKSHRGIASSSLVVSLNLRYFDLIGYPPGYNKNHGHKQNGFKSFNGNSASTSSENGTLLSFTNEQMMKLMNLINEVPYGNMQANMAGRASFFNINVFFNINFKVFFNSNSVTCKITMGWIIDSGANQHMTISAVNTLGIIDISDLNLTVGHPNGTLAKIKYVGNLILSENVVLVVPEYCVSLLSVNKLIKDSKMFVGLTETKCNQSVVCYVSKSLWHTRLGHPSDQVVDVLQHDLNFTKNSQVSLCYICHKAKQTREPFPFSDHQTTIIGEIIYLDQSGPYKDEVYDLFASFVDLVLNQFKCSIKIMRLPSFVLNGKSPFELVYGFKPKLSHLRSFGCLCFSSILNNSDKFYPRSEKCILIGFSTTKKAYKVYNLESKLVFYLRNVKFYETVFPFKMNYALQNDQQIFEDSSDKNIHTLIFFDEKLSDTQSSISINDDRRGSAIANDDGNDHACTRSSNTTDNSEDDISTSIGDNSNYEGNVPTSSSLNTQRNLLENSSQVHPDLRKSSRSVKIPAKFNDYVDVYMTIRPGFDNDKSKVCKLNKSLYGLKQAPRKKYDDVFIVLLVYVDDIVITRNNLFEIEKFKLFLKSKFQIKDLGKLKYFFGIEVLDNKDGIYLSQRKYCLELLHEYGLLAAKHVDTPLLENTTLNHVESDDDHLLSNVRNYQRLMGKLIYLTNTKPDISYVVHCLSQFMHAPLESHLDVALRVLRYLKGSLGRGFQISKLGNLNLRAYVASDWARCPATRKYFPESMASATCEIIWLSNLLGDIGVKVREKVASGVIRTEKIHTSQQTADVLTKALDNGQHFVLCGKLSLMDMFQVEKLEGGWTEAVNC